MSITEIFGVDSYIRSLSDPAPGADRGFLALSRQWGNIKGSRWMGLFSAMARIASIPLVILTGCTAQGYQTEPPLAPPQPPPTPPVAVPTPSVVVPEPAPTPARLPLPQQRFSVPENTRDPVLVERGVKEWLDQQPEYPIYQKVAILHRMRQESSFNPCAVNGPMRYLLQWRDDRLHRLYQAARSHPGTCPSWLTQMQFMDSEIRSNNRYAQFFYTRNYPVAYRLFTQVYLGGVMGPLYD
jgi:hypothetical protein